MKRLAKKSQRSRNEPTIALINIVFLLLVFFLIAGQFNDLVPRGIQLLSFDDGENTLPENVVAIHANGDLTKAGQPIEREFLLTNADPQTAIRIAPDRDLDAVNFVEFVHALQEAGWQEVILLGDPPSIVQP